MLQLRARAAIVLATLVVTGGTSGCSLLVSTDGLDVGPYDAGGQDGARPGAALEGGAGDVATGAEAAAPTGGGASDASTAEASSAGPSDAGAPDAGAETGDAGSGVEAGGGFCASLSSLSPPPALCVDFDEGAPYDALFPQTFQPSPGHLGADGTAFVSPPGSFFATIDANTQATQASAYMARTFGGASSSVEYSFDFRVDNEVAGQYVVVAEIRVNANQQAEHSLTLAVASNAAEMEQAFASGGGWGGWMQTFVDTPIQPVPNASKWTHADISLSLAQGTMTVALDGATVVQGVALDASWPTSGPVTVNLGIPFVASVAGSWTVRYDNVVVNPN